MEGTHGTLDDAAGPSFDGLFWSDKRGIEFSAMIHQWDQSNAAEQEGVVSARDWYGMRQDVISKANLSRKSL